MLLSETVALVFELLFILLMHELCLNFLYNSFPTNRVDLCLVRASITFYCRTCCSF